MKTTGILFLVGACLAWADTQDEVVLLANARVAESVALAREYAALRGVDTNRIMALDLPDSESISRGFYELRLRDPLLARLRERDLIEQTRRDPKSVEPHESAWSTVRASFRYLVSFYGVPLRIADPVERLKDRAARSFNPDYLTESAAVDSELALLLADSYPLRGWINNPLYGKARREDAGAAGVKVLVACRLDGPDAATVRRMMSDALWAENHGLLGRAYFDLRAVHDDEYLQGDLWLRQAWMHMSLAGFECAVDRQDAVLGDLFPMSDACFYMGWYAEDAAGPFARGDFRFARGAIAYHLHSGNAASLRTTTSHWAGPLLARGACVTFGTVSEPFLLQTVNVGWFTELLSQGMRFGDSVYAATPGLSWQTTVIGDPLYTPFRLTLDDQLQQRARDSTPGEEYATVRRINLMVRDGRLNHALRYGREQLKARDSTALRERLGDLMALNDLFAEAASQYEAILENTDDPRTAVRVALRLDSMLRGIGMPEKATAAVERVRARWPDSPFLQLLAPVSP